jgi:hypothetical protein
MVVDHAPGAVVAAVHPTMAMSLPNIVVVYELDNEGRSTYGKKKGPISRPHVVALGLTPLFFHFVDQVDQTLHRKIHISA